MADFWAGYISGAAGIIIGSPLDIIKVRLQARARAERQSHYSFESVGSLVRGAAAPILGYGALNALLFVSYNNFLGFFGEFQENPSNLWKIWGAGALSGLVSFCVSSPTELVKCRAQLSTDQNSSWSITKEIVRTRGLRGLYFGGVVTSLRDSIGYGFYFWSYEGSKRLLAGPGGTGSTSASAILLCGGIAGCATWLSIYPLDVIKTRVQTQIQLTEWPLLPQGLQHHNYRPQNGAWACAKIAYAESGSRVFFNGLGICMARAFLVNAIQWAIYEWAMDRMQPPQELVDNRIAI